MGKRTGEAGDGRSERCREGTRGERVQLEAEGEGEGTE